MSLPCWTHLIFILTVYLIKFLFLQVLVTYLFIDLPIFYLLFYLSICLCLSISYDQFSLSLHTSTYICLFCVLYLSLFVYIWTLVYSSADNTSQVTVLCATNIPLQMFTASVVPLVFWFYSQHSVILFSSSCFIDLKKKKYYFKYFFLFLFMFIFYCFIFVF